MGAEVRVPSLTSILDEDIEMADNPKLVTGPKAEGNTPGAAKGGQEAVVQAGAQEKGLPCNGTDHLLD